MASRAPRKPIIPGAHPCPECGGDLPPSTSRGRKRVFCGETCKQTHANRMASRGKALAKIAMGWRVARGSGDAGKTLFAEMTAMLDAFNSEDSAAGRMRADDYAMLTINSFASPSYMDRRVSRVHCDAQAGPDCIGTASSSGGTTIDIAQRMATNQGWSIAPDGTATCPNCIAHMGGEA